MKKCLLFVILTTLLACQSNTKTEETHENTALPGPEEIIAAITLPEIPDFELNIKDLGATGDGITNDLEYFRKALIQLEENGGGKLKVPAGNYYLEGPIHLISNMELHLEKDARLSFSSKAEHYLPVVKTSWEGTFLYNYSPFIYAYECTNVAMSGEGTIDGEASESWNTWKEKQKADQLLSRKMNHEETPMEERVFGEGHFLRPHLVQFFKCENVLVENVRLEDSPFWCLHLLQSSNITVRGISYDAHNKNNDGIDPEYSRNVLIENVTFNNADDNVAIKAGRDHEGRNSGLISENIVVRNCHFKGLHAMVIGSEMSAGVQNVHVYNCDYAGELKRGIYLKSNPDRGGFIRNVYVNNLEFGQVEDGIYITSYYHNEGEGHVTDISEVYFKNIRFKNASGTGIVLQGFPDNKLKDIHFENIIISQAKNGLSMENTENINFTEVTIGNQATSPTFVK